MPLITGYLLEKRLKFKQKKTTKNLGYCPSNKPTNIVLGLKKSVWKENKQALKIRLNLLFCEPKS